MMRKKRVVLSICIAFLLLALSFASALSLGKIKVNNNQEFNSESGIIHAGNLQIGDIFYLADGKKARVSGIEDIFNSGFDNKNFFANGVLVHNKGESWWTSSQGNLFVIRKLRGMGADGNAELSFHAAARMKPSGELTELPRDLIEAGIKNYDRIGNNGKYYLVGRGVPTGMVEDILKNPSVVYRQPSGNWDYLGCYERIANGKSLPVRVIVSSDGKRIVTILTEENLK